VIGNLECALTTRRERHVLKAFYFPADPRAVGILTAGNLRCVALANNHVLDAGPAGLFDTLRHLDSADIAHAGAGENLAAARSPVIFRAGKLVVGFASITNTLRAFRAGPERPGTAFLPISADSTSARLLASLVAAMKGTELKVLSVHWGPNFRSRPPRRYRRFAHQAIDAGFDIVHGHSAHLLQAVEAYRNGLILYDTGNFLDDYWIMPGFRMDRSFLFTVTVGPVSRPKLELFPVTVAPCAVNHAVGPEAETIRRAMVRRCRGYGVAFVAEGDALVAVPVADHGPTDGPAAGSIASASSTA
jgi:poly-gamma-glutamate synthesis protein (capsule biosynthesis protein)